MPDAKGIFSDLLCAVALAALALGLLPDVFVSQAHAESATGEEFFEKQIRPVLADNCLKCHGPQKQWSSLRLDSKAAALKGGDNGPALVAGEPNESEIVRRISATDDDRMPPPDDGKPLTVEQVAAIRQWIKLGAPWPESSTPHEEAKEKLWREHWAFQQIRKTVPPEVKSASRVVNAIDRFVIQRQEAAGLRLAPEADRRTLIRRATYDLTGLPPTEEEVSAFVEDAAPDAYERLIDRLLASARYGEQWGRYWLDIVRFADTKGYVYGRENRFFVNSALYRDWVIAAFNQDVPYDQFVKLQFAADLIAPDNPAQLAATGFLTLGRRLLGVTPDIIEDRIDMVGRGLLGLTIGCARCHDHKFDPIPTADYYSLYGVFDNCIDRQVPLPRPAGADNLPALEAELKKLQRAAEETWTKRGEEASERIRARVGDYLKAQRHLEDYPDLGVLPTPEKDDMQPAWVRRWR